MRKIYTTLLLFVASLTISAQDSNAGWPASYEGVMLQGFSWDSYVDTQWTNLESQADELSQYFDLIWVPQSGNCNSTGNQMGYSPYYWYDQNSSFGTEAQLRSMINTFKQKGTGIIADVVINHRNTDGWFTFPAEENGGTTWQLLPTDIVNNDDGGATKAEATKQGISISSNNDTGEGWDGMRDLDHKSSNVQANVNNYLKFLLEDMGYTGFRYDMTKGFGASYLGNYNATAKPAYSVGEYWDGNATKLKTWLDGTKVNGIIQSATFDFAFRYNVRDAANNSNWANLAKGSLVSDANYRRYAVTFIDNHDVQDRGTTNNYTPDPIKKDILAANAYLIAMPGTPCVFLLHWKPYKQQIKAMIDARKAAGIMNTSTYEQMTSQTSRYVASVNGSKGKLLVVVGTTSGYTADDSWVNVINDSRYQYYLSKSTETAWADKASGTYEEAFGVKVTAVSADNNAQIVYTTDGTDPTSSSTTVNSGSTINITEGCTLKVGLLVNGIVKSIITRQYVIKPFEPHKATVYVKKATGWDNMYFYVWANDGHNTQLNGGWPGNKVTDTKEIQGAVWYYKSFDINTKDYSFNIIFDKGSSNDQTVDIGPISEDTYFEISDTKSAGKFTVRDVTQEILTGIEVVRTAAPSFNDHAIYDLQGRKMSKDQLKKGIYIYQGKKILK